MGGAPDRRGDEDGRWSGQRPGGGTGHGGELPRHPPGSGPGGDPLRGRSPGTRSRRPRSLGKSGAVDRVRRRTGGHRAAGVRAHGTPRGFGPAAGAVLAIVLVSVGCATTGPPGVPPGARPLSPPPREPAGEGGSRVGGPPGEVPRPAGRGSEAPAPPEAGEPARTNEGSGKDSAPGGPGRAGFVAAVPPDSPAEVPAAGEAAEPLAPSREPPEREPPEHAREPAAPQESPGPEPGAETAILVVPEPAEVAPGEIVTLSVRLAAAVEVSSVPLLVRFDPRIVSFLDAAEGDFLRRDGAPTAFLASLDSSGRAVVVGNSRLGRRPGLSGDGEVCRLRFRALASGDPAFSVPRANVRAAGGAVVAAELTVLPARVR
ncbi:MAG: hypothetical protein D6718_07610 [Acidobacteria bacterium]|nr:MAG: hypothetical protein D6718_07610 [Acidobacteriota bacterium]